MQWLQIVIQAGNQFVNREADASGGLVAVKARGREGVPQQSALP